MKYLGLVRIQLESVPHIPLLDIGGACDAIDEGVRDFKPE